MPGAKVHAFTELAAELVANGHKALVFSQFVDFLDLLRAAAGRRRHRLPVPRRRHPRRRAHAAASPPSRPARATSS